MDQKTVTRQRLVELLNQKVAQDADCRRIMLGLPGDLEPISVGTIHWRVPEASTGCNWRWTGTVFDEVGSVRAQRLGIPRRATRLAAAIEPIVRRFQKRFLVNWGAEVWWIAQVISSLVYLRWTA